MYRAFLIAAAFALTASANAQSDKQTAQQERMKTCNAQASSKDMKGDERRDFMSQCLKGEDEPNLTAQQEKMKTCNREASEKQMKGDERRAFMKDCLSAKHDDLTAQQERMRTCNTQASAKDLKGDERKDFMSQCLRTDRGGERPSAAGGR